MSRKKKFPKSDVPFISDGMWNHLPKIKPVNPGLPGQFMNEVDVESICYSTCSGIGTPQGGGCARTPGGGSSIYCDCGDGTPYPGINSHYDCDGNPSTCSIAESYKRQYEDEFGGWVECSCGSNCWTCGCDNGTWDNNRCLFIAPCTNATNCFGDVTAEQFCHDYCDYESDFLWGPWGTCNEECNYTTSIRGWRTYWDELNNGFGGKDCCEMTFIECGNCPGCDYEWEYECWGSGNEGDCDWFIVGCRVMGAFSCGDSYCYENMGDSDYSSGDSYPGTIACITHSPQASNGDTNNNKLKKKITPQNSNKFQSNTSRGVECNCECGGGAVGGSIIHCNRYHNYTCESDCNNCITMNYNPNDSFMCDWDSNNNIYTAGPFAPSEGYGSYVMNSTLCEDWIQVYFNKLSGNDGRQSFLEAGYDADNWPEVISCEQFCDWFACFDSWLQWTQPQNCSVSDWNCGSTLGCMDPEACNYCVECDIDYYNTNSTGPFEDNSNQTEMTCKYFDTCGVCGGNNQLYPCWNGQNYC